MLLSSLAAGYQISGSTDPEITGISEDSRRVMPGMLFVAIRGTQDNGERYIDDARSRGAAAVASEGPATTGGVPHVLVPSAREALARFAATITGHPGRELSLIGFTGTFGKTSTSAILRELLDAGGRKVGVLGSLGARYGDFHDPGNGLTTPAPVELHRALRELRNAGADTVIMEVTSHGLRLGRVEGLTCIGGLLAAIKPGEHSDFHGSYEDYVGAKRLFLRYLSPEATLAYDADNFASRMLGSEAVVRVKSGMSLRGRRTDVRLMNITLDHTGARFTVDRRRLHSSLLGRGHLENVALALAYALSSGISIEAARPVLRRLRPLPRRMEQYDVAGRLVLDDTAGHPDSLRATFDVAAMLACSPRTSPDARIVIVFALRGSRGEEINRRNATALSDLVCEHGVSRLIVTGSADTAGPNDRVTPAEIDAARGAFASRHQKFTWFDTLEAATADALERTVPGDLIVLTGAQGMNEGGRLLGSAGAFQPTGSSS